VVSLTEAKIQLADLQEQLGNLKVGRHEAREVEYILYRTMSILNRLGLPPEFDEAIQKIERMIMVVRALHTTLVLLELGTPEGQIMAALSGIGAGISALSLAQDMK